jgi:hypothetical protein
MLWLILLFTSGAEGQTFTAPDHSPRLSNIVKENPSFQGHLCCLESNRSHDWVDTCTASFGSGWTYYATDSCSSLGAIHCKKGVQYDFCCDDEPFVASFGFAALSAACSLSNTILPSYNVTDFGNVPSAVYTVPSQIVALGVGTNVRTHIYDVHEADDTITQHAIMIANEGGNSYVTNMWAGLGWSNDTIWTAMGQPKRHIEISWLQVAELPTFPTAMVKLVWDPENLPYKLEGMMGGENPVYYWSGWITDELMGTRNVHSSETPVTFAYGSNYPSQATKVALSSFLNVGVLLSESVLEYNEEYADRKHYPFAVHRELNQLEVGKGYIPLLAKVIDVAQFVAHFCGLYPGPLIRAEMHGLAAEEGITMYSTMYSNPLPLYESGTPLMDSIYSKWSAGNIHVMMYGGCMASRVYTEMFVAKMILPTPGKFWFGDWQKLNVGHLMGDIGNQWDEQRCHAERDVLAGWVYHDALYKPVSYDKFCRWYVPLATPATLPWTAQWVATTMREWYYLDQWTVKHWGPGVESGYTPFRNGICSGRSEADLGLVTNYPYGSHYDQYDEMTFFWAQNMDSMWQLLWGHETATRNIGNSYSISDWLTETESAPGYGFFQDFNPGDQTNLEHQSVWVQYTREACSMWFNFNGDVDAEVIAEYHVDTHGESEIIPKAATKPPFCMPAIPPSTNLECEIGSFFDEFWGQCLKCNAGKYTDQAGLTACKLCIAGSFSATGASSCTNCPVGKAVATSGAIACTDCAAGKFAQDPGKEHCADCHVGRHNALIGQSGCVLCAVGKWQAEVQSTACHDCEGGSTTNKEGSFFQGDCQCESALQ